MNVLLNTQSYYVRNSFVASLIPKGIQLFHVESHDQVIDKIILNNVDILVIDVIQEEPDKIYSLMRSIKAHSNEKVKKTAIVLLIGIVDKQNVTQAIQAGAIGFIKSGATADVISDYIIQIYQKVKGIPPERRFVRVSLDSSNPNERIGVKFRSPINSQLIMGLIKDISFGGIAVELVGTFAADSLATGVDVKNIQFIIDGKDVFVDATVVAFRERFCAFRFTNMPHQESEIISQFIFQKMSVVRQEAQDKKEKTDDEEA